MLGLYLFVLIFGITVKTTTQIRFLTVAMATALADSLVPQVVGEIHEILHEL